MRICISGAIGGSLGALLARVPRPFARAPFFGHI